MDNKLNYQIILNLKDRVSAALGKVKKEFHAIDEAARKTEGSTDRVRSVCDRIAKLQFGNIVSLLDRSAQAFTSLGDSGAEFQQSMANLSSITGIAGRELSDLGKVARETGRSSGLGAKGAVDAFALLASQIQVDKIGMEGLKILQKETITLAQASGMGMADAATAMAATINQFGLEATEANRVINVLAAGSKYGAAEIVDLSQSFKVTGATASAAGLSVEQTAGALEVLSKSNLKGAEAGTALRNILLKMQTELKVDFGETGLSSALEALKPKLNDVTYLSKLFGAENISAAQFLITNAAAVDEMTQAVTGTSVAQEQAAVRTDTVAEKMKRMQASIDDAKIAVFGVTGAFTPYAVVIGETLPALASLLSVTGACSQAIAYFQQCNILAKTAILGKMATEKASLLVTYAVTAAQTALNAVMSANPIALVVLAIAGLVGGMVAAYNHCEGFRKVVDKTWTVIRNFSSMVWEHVAGAFKSLCEWIGKAWDKLKQFFGIQDAGTKSASKAEDSMEDLTFAQDKNVDSSKRLIKVAKENIETMNTLSSRIQGLKDKQKDLPQDQAIALQKEIELWEKKEKAMRNAILGTVNNKGSLDTIGGMEQRISDLQAIQKRSSMEQAVALEKEIRLWQRKMEAMRNAIAIATADKPALALLEAPAKNGIDPKRAKAINSKTSKDGEPIAPAINIPITFDERALTRVREALRTRMAEMRKDAEITGQQLQGLLGNGISSMMESLGSALASGDWTEAMRGMLVTMMDMLQQFASSLIAAGTAALAFQGLLFNPVAAIVAGGALLVATAAAKASLQNVTAFAQGGLVSGPTLALVGEYPGAANNPEVIAPLSKLRQLIQPAGESPGKLEFRIRGNDLFAIYNKVSHANTRTR